MGPEPSEYLQVADFQDKAVGDYLTILELIASISDKEKVLFQDTGAWVCDEISFKKLENCATCLACAMNT